MVQPLEAEKIILKTKQYEFSDGLRDIQLGITLILIGVFWSWGMYQPAWLGFILGIGEDYGKWVSTLAFILLLALPIVIGAALNRLMETLRRRWLWRESGMVKASSILVPSGINVLATVIFIVLIGFGIFFQHLLKTGDFYIWSVILLAIGWSFGVVLVGMGRNLQLPRYVIMGVIGGLASTGTLLYQTSLSGAGLVFYLGWGLILLVGGAIVLSRAWPQVKEGSNAG